VIAELNIDHTISSDGMYSKPHWTAYEGWKVRGRPVLTMRRGEVIARDGKILAAPGSGRYIAGVPQAFDTVVPGRSPGLALRPA
jgi:dihydropyrimidinase